MPTAYLTPAQARTRLQAYGIDAEPPAAIIMVASDDLDLKGPFLGDTVEPVQYRQFPRTPAIQDDVAGDVPGRILDWVALRAYQLTEDDDAPVLVEKVDKLAVEYGGRGKRSTQARLMRNLLRYYRCANIRIV